MSKQFYLPATIAAKVNWLKNFADKLLGHSAAVGVSAAEIASVEADRDALEFMVEQTLFIRQDSQEYTAYLQLLLGNSEREDIGGFPTVSVSPIGPPGVVLSGIFTRIARLVKRIKAAEDYTTAIGEDLGIIGPDVNFDPDAYTTTLRAEVRNNAVRISFIKGLVDSVVIYSRLKGETVWEKIGVADTSPFIDTRPLANANRPEVREYMGKGRIANVEIGLPSLIATVTFAG